MKGIAFSGPQNHDGCSLWGLIPPYLGTCTPWAGDQASYGVDEGQTIVTATSQGNDTGSDTMVDNDIYHDSGTITVPR